MLVRGDCAEAAVLVLSDAAFCVPVPSAELKQTLWRAVGKREKGWDLPCTLSSGLGRLRTFETLEPDICQRWATYW